MKAFLAVVLLVAAVAAENLCPAEQSTNWEIELLLPHEDCNKFYKCTFGQPVEQFCYGDLHFNLETWQCDFPQNVDCGERNDPAVEDKEESGEKVEVVEPELEPEVVEPEPEVVKPETEEVEAEEVKPETEEAEPETEEAKPETEEAKPESEEAEPETEEVAPEVVKPEVSEPEQETEDCEDSAENGEQNPEIEFSENGCPVDPHIHWLLPHESDCNQFYYCVWGQKELRNCYGSLHFNPILQVCDWPWDAGCAVSANRHLGARAMYLR